MSRIAVIVSDAEDSRALCRLCMIYHESFVNIFTPNNTFRICAEKAIHDLLSLKVAVGDGLPSNICHQCVKKLMDFRDFKKMCLKTAAELRKCDLDIFLKALKKEVQEPKGVVGDGNSLGHISPHEQIQVTEVFVPVPDEVAMGSVCHVEEDSRPSQLMVKEEIGEGLDGSENNVPVVSLSSFDVDPLAVDTTVDSCNYIGGIPGVPEVYLDKFVSGRQENLQPQLASNSSYDHMHEENLQFEYSLGNSLVAHCYSGKIPKRKENIKLSDSSKMSSSSNDLKELKCDTCGKNFRYSSDLKKHSVIHSGVKPYRCDMCGKTFTEKRHLKRHSFVHSGLKPFKCNVCGKGFTEKSDIKKHLPIHTGVKPYKCAVCGKGFTQSGSLKSHLVVHTGVKPFKCDVCGKMFTQSGHLATHSVVHTDEKKFKCNVCGKNFSVNSSLKKHSVVHTGVKPYKCTVCGQMFTQRYSLKSHSVVHTGVKPFKCDVCGKMFTQRSNLATHSVVHTGEKKFKCNICGKNFSVKSSLKKHSVVHTGVKPYKCTVCGKMFTQSGSLKKHSIFHSGLKPFKCDVCGKMFTRSGNLASHMVIHSGE